jgi:hypothetical protein
MKVFLSCVSSEFKSYCLKLASHLAAARGESFTVKVQEDFQQGGFTLLEHLADFTRGCDLVIHLVGDACGARPEPEHVRALLRSLRETPSDPLTRRRRPTAKARGQFSSRWKRIVLGISGKALPDLLEDGRLARPELVYGLLAFADIGVYPLSVLVVIREGRMDI